MFIKSIIKYVILGMIAGLISSCAQVDTRQSYPWRGNLVWPDQPAKARIKYLGSFSNPEEFGIGKGFFELVVDFFTGAREQRLIRPMAVVAISEYEIYVADPGARGVHYFNSRDNDYRLIQLNNNMPLPSPVGLTIGPDNKVLVADSELGRIFSLSATSKYAIPFHLQYMLKQPTGITYNKEIHRLYVSDTESHAVHIYDKYGKFIKSVGSRGSGRLKFNYPTMLSLTPNGQLLVTDSLNFRVQRLTHNGSFISQFGQIGAVSGKMSRPKGVATDSLGHVYIVDSLFHAVQIFDKKGRLLLQLGQQGTKPGEFWLPTGIYIGENNTIYIADSHNQRIQVFSYIGGGK